MSNEASPRRLGPVRATSVALRAPSIALLAALSLATIGCGASRDTIVGRGHLIDDVEFEGVERFGKETLLRHLFMGETSWIPLTPDYYHDEALLAVDAKRVKELYAAYGYYDVRVLELSLVPDDDDDEVDILLRVEEGEPVRIAKLDLVWEDATELPDEARTEVEALVGIAVGDPVEVPTINSAIGKLRTALLQLGHPLARVSGGATVDLAERSGELAFTLTPGPFASIGAVRFEGLREVPEELVQNEIEFVLGQPFSPARVKQIEQAIKAMRVFSWVATLPPETVEDGRVTLTVRLSEADPQSIAVGVQLALETTRWQEQARIDYTHTNVFGNLTRLDFKTIAGWAELPNPWAPDLHGPVLSVSPLFTKKGWLEKHLLWGFGPRFEVDVEEGYQYYSPSSRLSVSRWFDGWLLASVSQNFRMVDFFNVSPELDAKSSLLGRDFRDPYLLSDVELAAQGFWLDSITSPRNGAAAELRYSVATAYLGSDFDFHKLVALVRAYWEPVAWIRIATRVSTGLMVTFGDNPGSPFNRRFYLGGANSVRGWGPRKLAPRLEECDDGGDCASVPVGGYTMVQGNFEIRFNVIGPVWLVGFVDVGDVQADELTYVPEEWNFSAGPGLRAETPVGLVRLDFGLRLNDTGVYPDEPSWGLYFGLGEAY